jgi:hypothetical protein
MMTDKERELKLLCGYIIISALLVGSSLCFVSYMEGFSTGAKRCRESSGEAFK